MKIRSEKLKNLMRKMPVVLGCSLAAAFLFMAAPMEADAIKLGSNPSGTAAPVQNEDSNAGEQNTDTTDESSQANQGGTVTSATVTATNVNVRSDATTKSTVAGKATSGQEVNVTGEKNDSEGKLWYAVNFESNGSTVTGYIRSDMVEAHMSAAAPEEPAAPETPEEAPETQDQTPAPAPTDDYFIKYEDDGVGASTWYLHDNMMGTRYKVEELLRAQETNQNNINEADSTTGKLKVIIVVMAAVILILIVVVTMFIIKLKNTYDDDDEYDDDDYDDEEDEDEEEEEEEQPRKHRFGRTASRRSHYEEEDEYDEDEEDEDEEEEVRPRPSQKTSAPKSDKNWQSKNFVDDDDLEFEFLDLK